MGKRLNETLEYLGNDYSIKRIDLEQCIYRKISNKFDIEISGLNARGRKFSTDVYVWDISNGSQIIEIFKCDSKENLKSTLNEILLKYSD